MAVAVDPFLIPIPKELLKDRQTRHYFEYLNRFLHDLWQRTGAGTDLVDESITENDTSTGEHHRNLAIISTIEGRLSAIESALNADGVQAQIRVLNRRINMLINSLIEEIKKIQPDLKAQRDTLELLHDLRIELKLLNVRVEEAFDTGFDESDVQ